MRRLLSALTVAAGTAAFLAVPVVARPAALPHPVRPFVEALAVTQVPDAAAAQPSETARRDARPPQAPSAHVLARLSRPSTHHFTLVGATWRTGSWEPGATTVEVRVRHAHGWSDWTAVAPQDGGADGGTADARRAARVQGATQTAEPIWVGGADGVEARVVGAGTASTPDDLHVVLVDGGSSAADADPVPAPVVGDSVAAADTGRPRIYTRADWGADESLRRHACPSGPDYSSTIEMGFIHHTDGGNGYTRRQVPAIIRSIYAYHVRGNGWCDVGYNYLVDRFGRIWEGRYGGITRPVIGAHTGGFNTDSFGVSLIGTFTSTRPPAAMTDAVERLFAWRLGRYYRDPGGLSTLTAGSFSGSRYRAGSDVTFRTVSGHRDADYTTCPGAVAYGELPDIRAAIAADMGAGFVEPRINRSSVPMGGGPVEVDAGVVADQTWRLAVTDATGTVVFSTTGTAGRTAPVAATWDLTGVAAAPVAPGDYTLRLTGSDAAGAAARPWSTTVTVTPPLTLHAPVQVALADPVTVRGKGVPGHTIDVTVAGADGTPQPVASVPVGDNGRWTTRRTPVPADRDLSFTASDPAASGYTATATTKVGPTVTAPTDATTLIDTGAALTVSGTALPADGNTVALTTVRVGGEPTTGAPLPVQPDGSWSVSFTPAAPTAFWVVDARGLQSAHLAVYPLGSPTATAPGSGYAGRRVTVSGDAGGPVSVTLSSRRSGEKWVAVDTVKATRAGTFQAALPLPTEPGATIAWRIATGHGSPAIGDVAVQPTFPPTVSGPRRVPWHATRSLSGTAVPGDRVRVRVAPVGSSTWAVAGSTTAADDGSWSLPVTFTDDTQWKATSPSGETSVGTTLVTPTIYARHSVQRRERVRVHGRAIPGHRVAVLRRLAGDTAWTKQFRVRAGSDGRWSVTLRPKRSADLRAVSHRRWSRIVTIGVG